MFPQGLDRISVGIAIAPVAGFEHPADLPGRGVEARGRGACAALRPAVRVLAEDAPDSERALLSLPESLASFGRDGSDELGDPSAHFAL